MNNPDPTTPRPADIFLHLIITFLTPMFLATTNGNVLQARAAATAAVAAYTTRNQTDLLPVALIIALGLAILDSLSRSMDDNLPVNLVLRLRGNVASLGRLAEQCRRALPADTTPDHPAPAVDPAAERRRQEDALAAVTRAEQRVAQVEAAFNNPQPPSPPPATPKPPAQPDRHAAAWAAAMTDVAREFATSLDDLPPHQRAAATTRAAVLSSVAQQLLSGEPLPPPQSSPGTTRPTHQRHHDNRI
jgi:hypothetical protein